MGIVNGIREWFFGIGNDKYKKDPYVGMCHDAQTKAAFKIYAIQICINKIANALSMCDFETYKGVGKTSKNYKGDLFYQLNVQPNLNQSASDFYQKLIYEAVYNKDGALVVQVNDQFVIADSYEVVEYAVLPNMYTQVTVGDLKFDKTFYEPNVLRFKLNNAKVANIIDGVYSEYGDLISGAIRNYNRGNAKKVWVKLGTMFDQLEQKVIRVDENGVEYTEANRVLDDLFKNRLAGHFSDKDSATPIEDGIDILENVDGRGGTTKSQVTTRDITSLFEDIVNYTADAFGIPRGLLKGDVADIEAMTENFISFCVGPVVNMIEDEYNRKLYTIEEFLKGDKLVIKTSRIRGTDPIKLASGAEAMYRIGVANVNYIRWLMREEPIDEEWAEDYALTKNYERNHDAENNKNNSENADTDSESTRADPSSEDN